MTALLMAIFRQNERFRHWLISSLLRLLRELFSALYWLTYAGRRWGGARYSDPFETFAFMNRWHRGWLVDGKSKRLSARVSYQSVLTRGGMGSGKTSTFVIPNLLKSDHRSFVVTDTSGEIYEACASSLKRRGYQLQSLDLMNLSQSLRYNPLAGLRSFTDIQQAAHLIIKSSPANSNPQDPFWAIAAEKILRLIVQASYHQSDPANFNLATIKYWLNQIAPDGDNKKLDQLMASSSQNDPTLWHDYRGFLRGNPKSLASIIMTADVALSAISNPVIADFTSQHDFDFSSLRTTKTALFVKVRELDMSYYAFLLNLFFTELFRSLLSTRNPNHLPVYLLLDEMGHLTIPDFAIFATTARKYRVAFWIFLQSLSQLESRYGKEEAQAILDGLATKIFLPGMDIETAEIISKTAGRKRRKDDSETSLYGELNMLNPDEVIYLERGEALMLHGNQRPIRFRTRAYFQ